MLHWYIHIKYKINLIKYSRLAALRDIKYLLRSSLMHLYLRICIYSGVRNEMHFQIIKERLLPGQYAVTIIQIVTKHFNTLLIGI